MDRVWKCSNVGELKSALLSAKAGDTVRLLKGCFQDPGTLKITCPIRLIGEGREEHGTKLDVKLEVDMKDRKQGDFRVLLVGFRRTFVDGKLVDLREDYRKHGELLLEGFRLCRGLVVKDSTNCSIVMRNLHVTETRSDRLIGPKKIDLDDSEIYLDGGPSGCLVINKWSNCPFKNCEIRFARARGIFVLACDSERRQLSPYQTVFDCCGCGINSGRFFLRGGPDPSRCAIDFKTGTFVPFAENEFPIACPVRIKGLTNRPEFNGKTGRVVNHVNSTGRIAVQIYCWPTQVLSLKPENLEYDGD